MIEHIDKISNKVQLIDFLTKLSNTNSNLKSWQSTDTKVLIDDFYVCLLSVFIIGISISMIDGDFLKEITLTEIYDFISNCQTEKNASAGTRGKLHCRAVLKHYTILEITINENNVFAITIMLKVEKNSEVAERTDWNSLLSCGKRTKHRLKITLPKKIKSYLICVGKFPVPWISVS